MKKPFVLILVCLLASAAISFAAPAALVIQLRLVLDTPSTDSETIVQVTRSKSVTTTNISYIIQKTVLLDQTALKSAEASTDGLKQPIVEITLTEDGARKFAEITKQNLHKRVAIIIDGQLVEAPFIQTEISDGKIQISGRFTKEETKALAKKISAAVKK